MIAALLAAAVALAVAVILPAPWCLLALMPWALGLWLYVESAHGRWNR